MTCGVSPRLRQLSSHLAQEHQQPCLELAYAAISDRKSCLQLLQVRQVMAMPSHLRALPPPHGELLGHLAYLLEYLHRCSPSALVLIR